MTRADLDHRLARLLADALLREMREGSTADPTERPLAPVAPARPGRAA